MRPEKSSIVSDLSETLNRSPFVLVADYKHMKVGDFSELRNRLAQTRAEVHVVKNSFLKRAMTDARLPAVDEKRGGQTAIVAGGKEAAPVAKILKNISTQVKKPRLNIGLNDLAGYSN